MLRPFSINFELRTHIMNKLFAIAAVGFIALGVMTSSCKKGNTVGAVGYPMDGDFPVFDTLYPPTSKYFFYGKFDGSFVTWQDSLRSKWDTATRDSSLALPGEQWINWPNYTKNIYYNFCDESEVDTCDKDGDIMLFQHHTEFIRPIEHPEMRMHIYFYDCIDTTIDNKYAPFNQADVIQMGANPFTDVDFGRSGVKVEFIDQNRKRWTTRAGSGQPWDTYFRVTDFYERDVLTDTLDTFAFFIVEGEFAGRLYNGVDEKVVTEAKFRARLVPREPQ